MRRLAMRGERAEGPAQRTSEAEKSGYREVRSASAIAIASVAQ